MYSRLSVPALLLTIAFSAQALESADPMRPDDQAVIQKSVTATGSKTTSKASTGLNLWIQSIQIGEGERSANINGKRVKVGDRVKGAQVIAIEHNQIKLRKGGKLIKLKFLPRKIKR